MSPLAIIVLCVQACLIQSVMSQFGCGCGSSIYNNLGSYGLNSGLLAPSAGLGNAALSAVSAGSCGSYGGQGTGEVAVAGNVGASGNTVVVGSVPVIGAVDFGGLIPACGSVSISGQCGCGCGCGCL